MVLGVVCAGIGGHSTRQSAGGGGMGGAVGVKLGVEHALLIAANAALSSRGAVARGGMGQGLDTPRKAIALGLRFSGALGLSASCDTASFSSGVRTLLFDGEPVCALDFCAHAVAAPASQSGHHSEGQ